MKDTAEYDVETNDSRDQRTQFKKVEQHFKEQINGKQENKYRNFLGRMLQKYVLRNLLMQEINMKKGEEITSFIQKIPILMCGRTQKVHVHLQCLSRYRTSSIQASHRRVSDLFGSDHWSLYVLRVPLFFFSFGFLCHSLPIFFNRATDQIHLVISKYGTIKALHSAFVYLSTLQLIIVQMNADTWL